MTASAPRLVTELADIETLLLAPDSAALRDVQKRLAEVIVGIHESGTTEFGTGVRNSVVNIRSLLDSAKRFWSRRRPDPLPCLQYSAAGRLVENFSESTFALEV